MPTALNDLLPSPSRSFYLTLRVLPLRFVHILRPEGLGVAAECILGLKPYFSMVSRVLGH
jgi:hypothetical protein